MTFDQSNRTVNEIKKFAEGSDGEPVVKVKLVDDITMTEGSTLRARDHRGFIIFELDEATGDLGIKGSMRKL